MPIPSLQFKRDTTQTHNPSLCYDLGDPAVTEARTKPFYFFFSSRSQGPFRRTTASKPSTIHSSLFFSLSPFPSFPFPSSSPQWWGVNEGEIVNRRKKWITRKRGENEVNQREIGVNEREKGVNEWVKKWMKVYEKSASR